MKPIENQKILMVSSTLNEGSTKKIDYSALLHQYILSKWYLYALFLVVCLGLVYFLLLITEPQYEIKSRVLIREEEEGMAYDQDMLRRSLNFSAVSENTFNEKYLLNSFSSFYDIVEELDLNIKYYWKNNLSKHQGYKDFPLVVDTFSLNPAYRKNASFDITIRPISEEVFQFMEQNKSIGTYNFGALFTNRFGTFQISPNGALPQDKDTKLHITFLNSNAVAESYIDKLKVEFTDKNATILQLTLEDAIPERGVDIMTKLIEKYQEQKLKEKNGITLNTLNFIDERLQNIGGELSDVETTIEQYKLRNDIAAETTSDLDLVMSNVDRLNNKQNDLRVQLKILESLENTFGSTNEDYELIPINVSITDNQLQSLIAPYNDAVLERRKILATAGPSNPLTQTVEQKLSSLKRSIRAAVNNLQSDLNMELKSLENQYEKSLGRLRSVPGKERNLLDKSRKKEFTEKLYLYLLEKKEETALTLISSSPNFRIVEPPRSSVDTVAPNKMLFYFGGTLAGLGFPFVLILVTTLLKDIIQTEEEVKEILPDQHISGLILLHKGNKQHQGLASEDFSSLRMDLQLRYKERLRGVMVTSSVAHEGKTFVAKHLAINFAKARFNTVLLDFDLRKPTGPNRTDTVAESGLSDYLKGERTIQEIIQPMEAFPHLHFIPKGAALSNPIEFFSEKKINELFTFLKAAYDIVIIDTSPVGIFSDALLLNDHVNASLFVLRSGFTKKAMVENAGELFKQGKLTNPSLVLNALQVKRIKNYKYYKY